MFYSNFKPNLFHEKNLTTGSHSLITDLSNDVFFHIHTLLSFNKNMGE